MSDNRVEDDEKVGILFPLVATVGILVGAFLVVLAWTWFQHWVVKQPYCTESTKIVKVEQLSRDGGKFEDEAYKLTFSNGSVGLISNAAAYGEVCLHSEVMHPSEKRAQGLRKESSYTKVNEINMR
jgi:hypothetical protein